MQLHFPARQFLPVQCPHLGEVAIHAAGEELHAHAALPAERLGERSEAAHVGNHNGGCKQRNIRGQLMCRASKANK